MRMTPDEKTKRTEAAYATLVAAVTKLRDSYVAPGNPQYRAGISQWPVLDRILQEADEVLKGRD